MDRKMNILDWIAVILLIVGGLNWGLVGFFGFNLVSFIFGDMTIVSRVIYGLVGLSAIYIAAIPSLLGRSERFPGEPLRT